MAVIPPANTASASTLRQLKWLAIVLAISNILLGLFSMYALRQADRRYTALIGRSVPVMNDLQSLTANAGQAMVSTNLGRLSGVDPRSYVNAVNDALNADLTLRQHILAASWLKADDSERRAIQTAGDAFTAAAKTLLSLAEGGRIADAARDRDLKLRPAFSRYVDAITAAADVLERESRRLNASESQRTSSLSTLLLGVASWPILVVILLLIVTAIFVLVLMVLFRGREMSDMP